MKQSKGFSLVELIIVIAIMAILVGVMAPQLVNYIEKTRVSADIQFCDTIHTAIITAMSDPDVISDSTSQEMLYDAYGILNNTTGARLDRYGAGSKWVTCPFAEDVTEVVGVDLFTLGTDHSQYLKSKGARDNGIICVVPNAEGTECAVFIANSNRNPKLPTEDYVGTYANIDYSNVIYVK